MKNVKNKLRGIVKSVYHKWNPQYKYIMDINDRTIRLENRISSLEAKPVSYQNENMDSLERLFLASDMMLYRFLYLLRYIKENDIVLDLEGEYGTGADLLSRYTPVDSCLCLNTIDYYTRLGNMYHSSDYVHFRTGTIYELSEKFNIITALNEKKARIFCKNDIEKLYELLEYHGILAIAYEDESSVWDEGVLKNIGFSLEAKFYQNKCSPELISQKTEKYTSIIYLRKNA